jgi:hypothetical protein
MADTHRDFANYHWPSLLKTSRQMLTTGWPCQEGLNWRKPSGVRPTVECNTAIANVLTLRGSAIADAPVADFPPDDFYVEWSPVHSRCRGSPFRLVGHDKVRCCIHQSIIIILQMHDNLLTYPHPNVCRVQRWYRTALGYGSQLSIARHGPGARLPLEHSCISTKSTGQQRMTSWMRLCRQSV